MFNSSSVLHIWTHAEHVTAMRDNTVCVTGQQETCWWDKHNSFFWGHKHNKLCKVMITSSGIKGFSHLSFENNQNPLSCIASTDEWITAKNWRWPPHQWLDQVGLWLMAQMVCEHGGVRTGKKKLQKVCVVTRQNNSAFVLPWKLEDGAQKDVIFDLFTFELQNREKHGLLHVSLLLAASWAANWD